MIWTQVGAHYENVFDNKFDEDSFLSLLKADSFDFY